METFTKFIREDVDAVIINIYRTRFDEISKVLGKSIRGEDRERSILLI